MLMRSLILTKENGRKRDATLLTDCCINRITKQDMKMSDNNGLYNSNIIIKITK